MHPPLWVYRPARRDKGLAGHLAAEHSLQRNGRTHPAEDVQLDLLEVQQGH
jgi:hypothetical protein